MPGNSPTEAALLSNLYDAINLKFSEFDCKRSTFRSYTGFVLAVVKSDFPFPPGAARHLNNGVFHSLIFHQIGPHMSGPGRKPKRWTSMFTCVLNDSN
jgi:hypothetical protein